MEPNERSARQSLIDVCVAAERLGLNRGTSGNASARWGDGLLITPSALPYEACRAEDLVFLDASGRPHGARRPSTEWSFHHRILRRRSELGAVLHLHSPAATALSTLREGIPAFHYMVAVAGGDSIRCAPYATFGTGELAELAVEALEGRTACLLANHGLIACAADPAAALALAVEVEALADQYLRARSVGSPHLLTAGEMAEVLERFAAYRAPR